MQLVDKKNKISLNDLKQMAEKKYGGLVKAVVDVEQKIMVIAGDMHADEETYLINLGSKQENLWGINLYPQNPGEEFIEFDSIINLRPKQGNLSRFVENKSLRAKIIAIVNQLIIKDE